MSRRVIIALASLTAAALAYGLFALVVTGELDTPPLPPLPRCEAIAGVVGGEDIALDRRARGPRGAVVAWIAADDRRAAAAGRPVAGRIWRLDGDASAPVDATPTLPFALHPHGIGLARDVSATALAAPGAAPGDAAVTATLALVNHRGGGVFAAEQDAVELFDVVGDQRLRHRRSVIDPLLRPMNDVAPVDSDRFYASLDHRHPAGPLRVAEELGRLPWSGVAYFDGAHARLVATGLRYANGVALSADAATLWVAATTDRAVLGYARDGASGDLRPRLRWEVGTGVDNIDIDERGDLWLGAHPRLLTFLRHAADAGVPSPSQVLRIDAATGAASVVWGDDGRLLPGAAAAATWPLAGGERRLLIGPVFAAHMLDCRLPAGAVGER